VGGQSGGFRQPVFAGQTVLLPELAIPNFKLWQTDSARLAEINIHYDALPGAKVPLPSCYGPNFGEHQLTSRTHRRRGGLCEEFDRLLASQ
jgi:hypothetical protein